MGENTLFRFLFIPFYKEAKKFIIKKVWELKALNSFLIGKLGSKCHNFSKNEVREFSHFGTV